MNFVNTIIPKQEYKDKDSLGSKIIVHLDPIEKDGDIYCAETIVDEYKEDEINSAYSEWKKRINDEELKIAKDNKINDISKYDTSDAVNSFSINGVSLWLNRNDRNALMRRFEAEKASGIENTTLWYGINKFDLAVYDAINMLNNIEVYACKCYDATASHKAAVEHLTSIDDVNNYNYTTGYPDKISL